MENPSSFRRLVVRMVCTLVGLLLLYVLSSGPAAYLATRSDILIPLFEKLYLPLIVASERASLHPLLERYVNWWEALNSN